MEVSVVIPLLDSPVVGRTIAGLRGQAGDADGMEIIVVGRDGHGQVPSGPEICFVDTGRPAPPATARNRGAALSKGSWIFFLDADAIPTPNWLRYLLNHLRAGRPIVSGSVSFPRHNYWAWSDNVSAFHEFLPTSSAGRRRYLPTIGLGIYRETLAQIGPFEEHYSCAEDMDFTLRAYCAGYPLFFEPKAILLHLPHRNNLAAILKRRFRAGYEMIHVRHRYRHVLRTPFILRHWIPLALFSPWLTLAATTHLYLRHVANWRDLATFPAVFLTKLAWCAGAFQRLRERRRHGQGW